MEQRGSGWNDSEADKHLENWVFQQQGEMADWKRLSHLSSANLASISKQGNLQSKFCHEVFKRGPGENIKKLFKMSE